MLNRAFDAVWADIAGFYGDDPAIVQNARNKLADALLKAADRDGARDVEAMRRAALTMLALSFRPRRLAAPALERLTRTKPNRNDWADPRRERCPSKEDALIEIHPVPQVAVYPASHT